VECLPNETRSRFHRGEAYSSGVANIFFNLSSACPVKFFEEKERSSFNRGALCVSACPMKSLLHLFHRGGEFFPFNEQSVDT
jgi:hypothetical protein